MRLNVYIDGEYELGLANVKENSLPPVVKVLLKQPKINKLEMTESGQKFEFIVDGVSEMVYTTPDKGLIALLSSNPVYKLEEDDVVPGRQ